MQRPAKKPNTATFAELIAHLSAKEQQPQQNQINLYSLFRSRDIRTLIFRHLDFPDALRARLINKDFHAALTDDHEEWLITFAANTLAANYVCTASWRAIEKLIRWNSEVMFKQFDVTIVPGFTLSTCIVGYACFMRDRYLLNICKAALKPAQQEKYKAIVLSYPINDELMTLNKILTHEDYKTFMTLVERWLNKEASIKDLRDYLLKKTKEMSETNQIYCMQPFYWACAAYLELCERAVNHDPLVTNTHLDEFWVKVDGYAKRLLAPRHMRFQMQAKEDTTTGDHHWGVDAKFAEVSYPVDCRVRDLRKTQEVYVDPDSDANPDVCGENYSLIRARCGVRHLSALGQPRVAYGRQGRLEDLETFFHLENVRNTQLIGEQIELDSKKRPKYSPR